MWRKVIVGDVSRLNNAFKRLISSSSSKNSSSSEESSISKLEMKDLQIAEETDLITRGPLPMITSRELERVPPHRPPRQAWVENLDRIEEEKLGLIDLHPLIFGAYPQIDFIFRNKFWQSRYREVQWIKERTRAEMPGGGRKPWPQKGLGKARHGSIRSPLWLHGGKAHGLRGPMTKFSMMDFNSRIRGLTSTLSAKFAQDDIHFVDTLDLPSADPKFLEELVESRAWGLSTLFIDDTDIFPKNIALATLEIEHMNIMPVYGLNVFSMLKHDTLVLTLAAVNRIEEKLIGHIYRNDVLFGQRQFKGISGFT